jgi:hypothetical protein
MACSYTFAFPLRGSDYAHAPAYGSLAAQVKAAVETREAAPLYATVDLRPYVAELERRMPSFVGEVANRLATNECECKSRALCDNIRTFPEQEIFGYNVQNVFDDTTNAHYEKCMHIMTSAVTGAYDNGWSWQVLCNAHENGIRILLSSPGGLGNAIQTFSNVSWRG